MTDIADDAEARAKLRAASLKVKSEEARLTALHAGLDRALQVQRDARDKLDDAETALTEARREQGQYQVYRFLNGGDDVDDPVAIAETKVTAVSAELEKLVGIESGLAGEIDRVEANLRQLRSNLYRTLADVVAASPQYQALAREHVALWHRLRTVRAALETVADGLHGHATPAMYDAPRRVEPLDERVEYPIDRDFVATWAIAMAELDRDADAALPGASDNAALPPPVRRINGNGNHVARPGK